MRLFTVLLAILGLVVAGCGDDDDAEDDADQVDELEQELDELEHEVEAQGDEAGARVAAETVRASLTARELGEDENLRDTTILEDATEDVPGDPEVAGLEDADGDGRDDDGLVEMKVGEGSACVSVSEDGETVDVEGAACS